MFINFCHRLHSHDLEGTMNELLHHGQSNIDLDWRRGGGAVLPHYLQWSHEYFLTSKRLTVLILGSSYSVKL